MTEPQEKATPQQPVEETTATEPPSANNSSSKSDGIKAIKGTTDPNLDPDSNNTSSTTSSPPTSILSKPEHYSNLAGARIEETLQPVNNTVGTGLQTVARPVGSVVDGVVGGVMRSGEAVGEVVGVGFGNKK